jgi:hypothetical protein
VRALLDVNVVIALLDPDHVFHESAHAWWAENRAGGWAGCPITENGVVRIMSNPGYSQAIRFTPGDLISQLGEFASSSDHEFWADDLSLLDSELFDHRRIHGSRQLRDIYLLALAVAHGGRLVTFDRNIPLSTVREATHSNLCAI